MSARQSISRMYLTTHPRRCLARYFVWRGIFEYMYVCAPLSWTRDRSRQPPHRTRGPATRAARHTMFGKSGVESHKNDVRVKDEDGWCAVEIALDNFGLSRLEM